MQRYTTKRNGLVFWLVLLWANPVSIVLGKDVTEVDTRFSATRTSASTRSLSQEQLADMYDMNIQQWHDYQKVMQGPRGLWSPNIHPLMALGMRKGISDAERKKLAKQYATIHYERVKRELAFEHDVFEAGMRKYGHLPLFREKFSAGNTEAIKHIFENDPAFGTRIQYFVKPDCSAICKTNIQEWIRKGKSFDLFIAGNKQAINRFARQMGISPLLVPHQITLNPMKLSEMQALGITQLPALRHTKEKTP